MSVFWYYGQASGCSCLSVRSRVFVFSLTGTLIGTLIGTLHDYYGRTQRTLTGTLTGTLHDYYGHMHKKALP